MKPVGARHGQSIAKARLHLKILCPRACPCRSPCHRSRTVDHCRRRTHPSCLDPSLCSCLCPHRPHAAARCTRRITELCAQLPCTAISHSAAIHRDPASLFFEPRSALLTMQHASSPRSSLRSPLRTFLCLCSSATLLPYLPLLAAPRASAAAPLHRASVSSSSRASLPRCCSFQPLRR